MSSIKYERGLEMLEIKTNEDMARLKQLENLEVHGKKVNIEIPEFNEGYQYIKGGK